DNPAKKKTYDGMTAFLGRWLAKAQNEAGRGYGQSSFARGPAQPVAPSKPTVLDTPNKRLTSEDITRVQAQRNGPGVAGTGPAQAQDARTGASTSQQTKGDS